MTPEEKAVQARLLAFLSNFDPVTETPAADFEAKYFKAKDAEVKKNNGRWLRGKKDGRLLFVYPKISGSVAFGYADGEEPDEVIFDAL